MLNGLLHTRLSELLALLLVSCRVLLMGWLVSCRVLLMGWLVSCRVLLMGWLVSCRVLLMGWLVSCALLLVGCGAAPMEFISLSGEMLGTQYNITAELPRGSGRFVTAEAERLDERMKREMSIFDPSSQLSKINRGETNELTPWIEQNIRLADSISRLSGGLYDITCAPLVRAWGFAGGKPRFDIEPNIDSLLQFVGYKTIAVSGGELQRQDPRTQIDLNSIAKGFAVDRLAEILVRAGAQNLMVDIGGELVTKGTNPKGGGWRIGIETPIDGNMTNGELLQRRIVIDPDSKLRAVATSGNYRRFHTGANGEKVVHTINPLTGRAESSGLLSVTVMARTCAEADAMATMLLAAGDRRAEAIADGLENCEVYLIYNSEAAGLYRIYCSQGMRRLLLD
ncbi:MAG: FAD:protein FMN transferase [Rikenellaceae bacterium]